MRIKSRFQRESSCCADASCRRICAGEPPLGLRAGKGGRPGSPVPAAPTQVEAEEGRGGHVPEQHDLHPGVLVLDLGDVEKHKLSGKEEKKNTQTHVEMTLREAPPPPQDEMSVRKAQTPPRPRAHLAPSLSSPAVL